MYESAGVRGAALPRSGDKTQTSKRVTMGCHGVQLVRLIVSLSFSLGEKHMFLNGDIGLACSTNKSLVFDTSKWMEILKFSSSK